MRKSIKRTISVVMAGAMAMSLAACGSGSKTEPTTQATTPAAGSEAAGSEAAGAADSSNVQGDISFSWWGGDSRHAATEEAIKTFSTKYPGTNVTTEYGAWTGWEEKQSLNMVGGNAADLMQINWNWIDTYGKNGTAFMDLNQYSNIIDLTQFPKESLEACTVDGKLMAVPISLTGRLFYWNQTTFDEVGCEIPTDTDSLLAAGAAFKAYNEEYYPLALAEYDRIIFMVYYLESVYGKPWVVDNQINYTAEEIQAGFDFMNKLEEAHVIPTLAVYHGDMADSFDKNAKWIDGKYAGIMEWDSAVTKMKSAVEGSTNKPDQEIVIGDFLKFGDFDGGFTKISMAFAIPSTSKNPELAAKMINFLLNEEEGVEISSTERGIPCSVKGLEILNTKGIGDALVIEANQKVMAFSKFPLDPKFEHNDLKANPDGAYYKVFGKLSTKDIDSAQATKELMSAIDECMGN